MTRAHFVKSARKKNPAVNKGESYYWWKFRFGGKHFSKTPPQPSQLTQSAFWSALLSIKESASAPSSVEDVEAEIEDVRSELENLRDEVSGNRDNMPQSLQDGSTGELLQERVDALEEAISQLESIDTSFDFGELEEGSDDYDLADAARVDEIWEEVTSALDDISCS